MKVPPRKSSMKVNSGIFFSLFLLLQDMIDDPLISCQNFHTNFTTFPHFSIFDASKNILLLMIQVKMDFRNVYPKYHLLELT